jgi:hypothetical protein
MDTLQLQSPKTITLVSPSRLRTYLECPKRYDYVYNQELVSTAPQKGYFNKGNYGHELLHVYYQYLKETGLQAGSDEAVAMITARVRNDFTRVAAENQAELLSVYGIITKQIIRYIKEHSPRVDDGITVEQVERQIIYPMETYAMFGYCDLVYRDRSGVLHIRDHKTGDRAQTKLDAQFSNQLLFYAAVIYKSTGELPVAELNYINTREVKKTIPYETAFAFSPVTYTKTELEIYFKEICAVIEDMLQSSAVPHYGQHCRYCPFQTPCYLSRKGIDPAPIIAQHFVVVPRDKQGRHVAFTENNTEDDSTD